MDLLYHDTRAEITGVVVLEADMELTWVWMGGNLDLRKLQDMTNNVLKALRAHGTEIVNIQYASANYDEGHAQHSVCVTYQGASEPIDLDDDKPAPAGRVRRPSAG